jgi:hypothetical protein
MTYRRVTALKWQTRRDGSVLSHWHDAVPRRPRSEHNPLPDALGHVGAPDALHRHLPS